MQRDPAGFVKLGLADQQARGLHVKLDIRDQEVTGFTRTPPGTRQQAEPRLVGQGSQGTSWTQPSGFVKDIADVCRREEIRVGAVWRRDESAVRDLGLRQTRFQVDQKPAGNTQTRVLPGGPAGGRPAAGPVHREVGTKRGAIAMLCEVRHKVWQEPSGRMYGVAQSLPEREIGVESSLQLVHVHSAPPGQGNATCANASRSSLAERAVVCRV